ncbi:MAG: LOG family protein [Candidatus Blackburnbacteria bacterium]|nr:LOG family protein [Candidatus Blackburnbacteria bacterium]
MKIRNVTFFGYSQAKPEEKLYKEAFEVAAEVAKAGYAVVNGAGPGVMRASTEGAKSVGGKTVGITFEPKDMKLFEGHDPENKVDELLEEPNYLQRTIRLIESGDIFIIFNGGTGTISEFGLTWALARLYFGHHKPFILYGGFWYPIMEEISRLMKIRKEELEVYRIVVEVKDVMDVLREFEAKFADGNGKYE